MRKPTKRRRWPSGIRNHLSKMILGMGKPICLFLCFFHRQLILLCVIMISIQTDPKLAFFVVRYTQICDTFRPIFIMGALFLFSFILFSVNPTQYAMNSLQHYNTIASLFFNMISILLQTLPSSFILLSLFIEPPSLRWNGFPLLYTSIILPYIPNTRFHFSYEVS